MYAVFNNAPGADAQMQHYNTAEEIEALGLTGEIDPDPVPVGTLFSVDDGVFSDTVDLVINETANGVRPKNTIEQVAERKVDYIARMRVLGARIAMGGFQYDERWWASDNDTVKLMGARAFAIESGQYKKSTFFYPDLDHVEVKIKRKNFEKLVGAYDLHVEDVRLAVLTLEGEFFQAADPATVDITQAWPPTRVPLVLE